jgi:hypothetical protein
MDIWQAHSMLYYYMVIVRDVFDAFHVLLLGRFFAICDTMMTVKVQGAQYSRRGDCPRWTNSVQCERLLKEDQITTTTCHKWFTVTHVLKLITYR